MSWIAPEVDRPDHAEPLVADERTTLEGRLEWQRATLLSKCAGLTAEQLAEKEKVVPPSNLSLLGLLRHVAQVERTWFQRGIAGRDDAPRVYRHRRRRLQGRQSRRSRGSVGWSLHPAIWCFAPTADRANPQMTGFSWSSASRKLRSRKSCCGAGPRNATMPG